MWTTRWVARKPTVIQGSYAKSTAPSFDFYDLTAMKKDWILSSPRDLGQQAQVLYQLRGTRQEAITGSPRLLLPAAAT